MAISHRRLLSLKDRIVTFTFRQPGSNRLRSTRLEVIEFIRRFLPHVLPTGFVKVRHFGLMNANGTVAITTLRGLIAQQNATLAKPPQTTSSHNRAGGAVALSPLWRTASGRDAGLARATGGGRYGLRAVPFTLI